MPKRADMKVLTRQEEQILLIVHRLGMDACLINVRECLKEMTGKYLDVGTVYVPLKRLTRHGYLNSRYGEPTGVRGGKAVRYYRMTGNGYRALAEVKMVQDKLWEGIVIPAPKG